MVVGSPLIMLLTLACVEDEFGIIPVGIAPIFNLYLMLTFPIDSFDPKYLLIFYITAGYFTLLSLAIDIFDMWDNWGDFRCVFSRTETLFPCIVLYILLRFFPFLSVAAIWIVMIFFIFFSVGPAIGYLTD